MGNALSSRYQSRNWALLQGYPQLNRCNWYRVLNVGKQPMQRKTDNIANPQRAGLDSNLDATLVVVPGAIGVYSTIMELDWDALRTR